MSSEVRVSPPDLERVADRDHAVVARAEQREVTPVRVQGVTLLGPRIDLPGDRDRLLAEGGRFRVAINQHQDLAEARERARPFGRRPVGGRDRDGLAVGLEGAGARRRAPTGRARAPRAGSLRGAGRRPGRRQRAASLRCARRAGNRRTGTPPGPPCAAARPGRSRQRARVVDVVPQLERTFVLDRAAPNAYDPIAASAARMDAANARSSWRAAAQWCASSAQRPASAAPPTGVRASSASAKARCRVRRSPGSRSSYTTSWTSAWRNA